LIKSRLYSHFIGYQNTPPKGFHSCEVHKDLAHEFTNEEESVAVAEAGSSLLIVSILNERILRQDCLRGTLSYIKLEQNNRIHLQ